MTDDAELLRRYAEERSEEAFAELVRRHLNLVYFAALRQVGGDAHAAEDVAQLVFTDLARKARLLARREVLASWLYTSTRFAATKARRTSTRRLKHETEAEIMRALNDEPASTAEWEKLRPLVDDIVHELGERDRGVVVLRFFEGRPFAEIGAAYGVSEDAARMRVERALDRLRALLAKRGVTSTSAALGAILVEQAAVAAPAGLAASITGAALMGGGSVAAAGLLAFMSTTKMTSVIAGTLVLLALGTAWHEVRAAREAETTLIAATRENDLRVARLRDGENRSRAATQELGDLQKTLADTHATQAADAQRAARAADAPTKGARDPVAEGRAFLEAHPAVKRALVDRARARVAGERQTFYAKAGLSPQEIEGLENILMEMNGVTAMGPDGPLALWPGRVAPARQEVERRAREFLGEERYQQMGESQRATGGFNFAAELAAALYFTDTPLTTEQATRFARIVVQDDRKRGSDRNGRDWPTLLEQSKAVLSEPQLDALARLRDQDEFGRAWKILLGK